MPLDKQSLPFVYSWRTESNDPCGHTVRKTLIGNLYKKVIDPSLVASLSGHTDGSLAFARYREIDTEMKSELVNNHDF